MVKLWQDKFLVRTVHIEKVGSDSGGGSCSILYLELMGGAVLIRKTEVEETQF